MNTNPFSGPMMSLPLSPSPRCSRRRTTDDRARLRRRRGAAGARAGAVRDRPDHRRPRARASSRAAAAPSCAAVGAGRRALREPGIARTGPTSGREPRRMRRDRPPSSTTTRETEGYSLMSVHPIRRRAPLIAASSLRRTAGGRAEFDARRGSRPARRRSYVPITGAGSTWSQNAIDAWRGNVDAVRHHGQLRRRRLVRRPHPVQQGTVDFAASEIPYGVQDGDDVDPPPTPRLRLHAGSSPAARRSCTT